MKRQGLGDQNYRRQQAKAKKSQRHAEHNRVPLPKIRKIHQWIRTAQAPNQRGKQENHCAEEQAVEKSGTPPVETLPLVQSRKQQRETRAGVEESGKTRRRPGGFSRRRRGNSQVDAQNHDRRDQRGVPEHPVERKMFAIPAIKRRGDIHCKVNRRGVERQRERKKARRDVLQSKRECQWIKGSGGQPCNHQRGQKQTVIMD